MSARAGLGLEWDVIDLLRAAAELAVDELAAQADVPDVSVEAVR